MLQTTHQLRLGSVGSFVRNSSSCLEISTDTSMKDLFSSCFVVGTLSLFVIGQETLTSRDGMYFAANFGWCKTTWTTGSLPYAYTTFTGRMGTDSDLTTLTAVTVPSTLYLFNGTPTSPTYTKEVWIATVNTTWTRSDATIPVTATETVQPAIGTTIATVTTTQTICTNNPSLPVTTVTSYTGSYSPVAGQVTRLPTEWPSEVLCFRSYTTFWNVHVTVISNETVTSTLETGTVTIPRTWTTTIIPPADETVTEYRPNLTVALSSFTHSTSCGQTATVTHDLRCAPSNMIGAMEGTDKGLAILSFNNYSSGVSLWGQPDSEHPMGSGGGPGACCQLCLDNEGCVANSYSQGYFYGTCGLIYVGGDEVCPVAYTYGPATEKDPGDFYVPGGPWYAQIFQQSGKGCGSIVYDPAG
ncbi:hypothetical protein V8F20_009807 [Naviculisporaceae sp. PSN 640]